MRLTARTLRGVEGAFWFVLALAIALGGQGALDGLPELGQMFSPHGIMTAEASGGRLTAGSARLAVSGFDPSPYPTTVLYPVEAREIPGWMQGANAAPPPAPVQNRIPAIAIVIDDMGSDPGRARRAMALPREIALSFLPYAQDTPSLAREAARAGHDVMAHVPMQAEADADPGPMALFVNQPRDEMIRRLDWNLSRVPGFAGINNHMGSRFTEDRAALALIMPALEGRSIFFFDSLTSPRSQAAAVARGFGVASAARDVFLDDTQTAEEISTQLGILERLARQNGVALAIGHPHDVTLGLLERWCAGLNGVRLARIKDAIRMKTEREMGVPVAALSQGE
jgi:uncharacterized protein